MSSRGRAIYNNGKSAGENYADANVAEMLYEGLVGAFLGGLGGAVELKSSYKNYALPGVETPSASYSVQEAESIKREGRTFRNLVAGVDTSVADFFAKWRTGRKSHQGEKLEKLYLGRLSDASLERASGILGYEMAERDAIVTNDDVKHVCDQHPELADWVFDALPAVIKSPDSIEKGHEGSGKNAGKTGIIFKKTLPGGNVVSVQFDNPGRGTMQVTTIYIEKSAPSKAAADVAAARTPEASEPALFDTSIPNSVKKSNTQNYALPGLEDVKAGAGAESMARWQEKRAMRLPGTLESRAAEYQAALAGWGVKGVIVDQALGGQDAFWNGADGSIHISPDMDPAAALDYKVKHELGHAAAQGDAGIVADTVGVMRSMGIDTEARTVQKMAEYADKVQGMTPEAAWAYAEEEVFGDFVAQLNRDTTALEWMVKKEPGLLRRILDAVEGFIRKLRGDGVEDAGEYSQLAARLREIVSAETGRDIRGNGKAAAQGDGGKRYSIEALADGKKYVKADRQVIFGNDPDAYGKYYKLNISVAYGDNGKVVYNVWNIQERGLPSFVRGKTANPSGSSAEKSGAQGGETSYAHTLSLADGGVKRESRGPVPEAGADMMAEAGG